jgi:hypothetical protein
MTLTPMQTGVLILAGIGLAWHRARRLNVVKHRPTTIPFEEGRNAEHA